MKNDTIFYLLALICIGLIFSFLLGAWIYDIKHPLCEFCSKYGRHATPETSLAFDLCIARLIVIPIILACLSLLFSTGIIHLFAPISGEEEKMSCDAITVFTVCPMLERCLKATRIDCKERAFLFCLCLASLLREEKMTLPRKYQDLRMQMKVKLPGATHHTWRRARRRIYEGYYR